MPDATHDIVNVSHIEPLLKVNDIERSVRFYVDGLGFTLTHHWDPDGTMRWCQLELGGAILMLQQNHPAVAPDDWASRHVGTGITLFFICKDAVAIYREAAARGINASRPQVLNHMWVTSLRDPDNYDIQFESHTDVAEETFLSE